MRGKAHVIAPYVRLPRIKGAWALRATSVVMGLPVAMFSLATLVIMALRQYSYAQMGGVLAAGLIARAVLLPLLAAIGNRYGPRWVLIPQVLVFCAATVALMQDAEFQKPISMLYLAGAIAGGTLPTVGAPLRTAWAALCRWSADRAGSTEAGDDPALRAVALEWSAIGDIAVLGPLFTMLLLATGHPRGGLVGVAAFAFFGVIGMVLQPSVDRAPRAGRNSATVAATGARPGQARRPAAVIALGLIALLSAATIAAIEISTVAAADRHGHHALAGLFLALGAVGCFASGLWKGWQKMPAHRGLMAALLLVVIAAALLWLAPNLWLLPVSLFLLGVFVRPAITSGFSILQGLVQPGRLTRALSWYGLCACLGAAAGVAAAGASIGKDGASGPADGYLTALAFAAAAALACLAALSSLGKPGRPGSAVPAAPTAARAPGGESGELPYIVGR
ncbi:MAG: transporter [Actinomycetia bacterium]|nr:transporter [Actinomycetes bacterium]